MRFLSKLEKYNGSDTEGRCFHWTAGLQPSHHICRYSCLWCLFWIQFTKSLEHIFKVMYKNNPSEMNGSNYVLKIRHMLKCKAEWNTVLSKWYFQVVLKLGQWKHIQSQGDSQHLTNPVCDAHSKPLELAIQGSSPGSMGKKTAACWRLRLPWALFCWLCSRICCAQKNICLRGRIWHWCTLEHF